MKKFTLILSVMFIWGCSQADDHTEVDEPVKQAVVAEVKDQTEVVVAEVKDQVEAVVDTAAEVAENVVDAVDAKFQPGIHYQVINPAWDTQTEDAVVVYEFFSYMCAHCASFEPYMKKLESEMPEHAKLVRIPVVFYPQWKPAAQAYYTFEAMGLVEQAHTAMFTAIHQYKKQFRTIEDVAEWAAGSFGVDKDQFLSTANSFMIDGQIRKGMQMMQALGVSSTPTLITNGKYVPNSKTFKTRDEIIDVTSYLIGLESANMGLPK
ncbi:thiol:disulfide interchange protein DsbA/DsbL [Marinicella litoralis]|uniref:Thiol:disulfide interchange protein DsbA n=1 Tax=Marinicella litoralis TaxID=644220 RepID=A0A4R6XT93_9GAMM|nr:thiol:disulfide interchange protein DsbA/DsbL [Marinicella litoralis]TDR23172.1 thiol:disulfide interchange protein DsbA [Marinicella litoralis]